MCQGASCCTHASPSSISLLVHIDSEACAEKRRADRWAAWALLRRQLREVDASKVKERVGCGEFIERFTNFKKVEYVVDAGRNILDARCRLPFVAATFEERWCVDCCQATEQWCDFCAKLALLQGFWDDIELDEAFRAVKDNAYIKCDGASMLSL